MTAALVGLLAMGYVPAATHFDAKHPSFSRAYCARLLMPFMMSSSELEASYPHEEMSPVECVDLQLEALQHGKAGLQIFWRFVSPEAKRATGTLRPGRRPYLTRPSYETDPLYAPLLKSLDYRVIGALPINAKKYKCRVRVWPAGGDRECAGEPIPLQPVEYIWHLTLQPLVRPVCYEDDPMQQGISTGPPFAGCWLVDDVKRDDRWGRGSDDESPVSPHGDDGASKKLGAAPTPALVRVLALAR